MCILIGFQCASTWGMFRNLHKLILCSQYNKKYLLKTYYLKNNFFKYLYFLIIQVIYGILPNPYFGPRNIIILKYRLTVKLKGLSINIDSISIKSCTWYILHLVPILQLLCYVVVGYKPLGSWNFVCHSDEILIN